MFGIQEESVVKIVALRNGISRIAAKTQFAGVGILTGIYFASFGAVISTVKLLGLMLPRIYLPKVSVSEVISGTVTATIMTVE